MNPGERQSEPKTNYLSGEGRAGGRAKNGHDVKKKGNGGGRTGRRNMVTQLGWEQSVKGKCSRQLEGL